MNMNKDIYAFENDMYDLVKDLLQKINKGKEELRFDTELVKLNKEKHSSEIRIYIFKNNKFVDVIEFFVFWEGVLKVKVEEIEEYLCNTLGRIIATK